MGVHQGCIAFFVPRTIWGDNYPARAIGEDPPPGMVKRSSGRGRSRGSGGFGPPVSGLRAGPGRVKKIPTIRESLV